MWDVFCKKLHKSPSSFSVFRCPYFSLFRESFFCVFSVFSQGSSLSRFAWSGALLTQDEALSRIGLAVTLGVALPATLFISISLSRSGRDAGFSLFYSFNFFLFPSSRISFEYFFFLGRSEVSIFRNEEMTLKKCAWPRYACVSHSC